MLPYKGEKGVDISKRLKTTLEKSLTGNVQPKIVFKGTKLSSKFGLKDKPKIQHKHDVVYKYECADGNCQQTYIGETGRRLKERVLDHQYRDKKSHILQHSMSSNHPPAEYSNFTILD